MTQDEFDKAQLAMREFVERDGINLGKWALRRKVRCGICGYTMTRSRAKHPVYYCRTNHVSDAFLVQIFSSRTLGQLDREHPAARL